jgi:hypothetical protein
MAYKWKPSASQKREFAQNMQNEVFKTDYYARKEVKENKRRSTSKFDYNTAGGNYIPTKEQHDFCLNNMELFETSEDKTACNIVMSGYICNEKTPHDFIHIVNEKRRNSVLV